ITLDPLAITDEYVIRNCVLARVSNEFVFGNPHLDGLMLDKAGIIPGSCGTYDDVVVCHDCYSALKSAKIPRLALRNNLYRGRLPDEFEDLTWVEEMACAVYRNTAHVTRLFDSSSPDQPTVLHGNTCAHEMNVVSTANVLPRTPADIHGMLSVVFVGPGEFDPAKSGTLFRVRKQKIWQFLVWLKAHNSLYLGLHFSNAALQLFPEDGPLPGLSEATIN
ncbi:hypothetical protein FA13DRAFT_1583938, partial [Coprinellus micaceus]